MLYLIEDRKRRKVNVYVRKLNAVYDHVNFTRKDNIRFKEIKEEEFDRVTYRKKIHYADCIRTVNGFELLEI